MRTVLLKRYSTLLCALCSLFVAGCAEEGEGSEFTGFGEVGLFSTATRAESYAFYGHFRVASDSCPLDENLSGCVYRDCTLPVDDATHAALAGRITVEGGARDVELSPREDGLYEPVLEEEPLYEGDELLTVDVEGSDEVPAHTASFRAPTPVAVSLPDLSAPVVIDRGKDLVVTWTGGSTETVQVSITRADLDEAEGTLRTRALACSFTRADRRGVIPTSALKRLPVTDEDATAAVSVGTWTDVSGTAGSFSYWFHATAHQEADVILE